jgi:hypothetical protein
VAIGGNYSQQKIYYNIYVTQDENWGFHVKPELGLIFRPQPHSGLGIIFAANYGYSSNTQKTFNIDGLTYFGLKLGVVFVD